MTQFGSHFTSPRGYLRPPHGGFWTWTDGGGVLAWADGSTIAFRNEVHAVLSALAPRGLPPFEAVVLLLAALRENWKEDDRVQTALSRVLENLPESDIALKLLAKVLLALDQVHELHALRRRTQTAKVSIAEMIFGAKVKDRSTRELGGQVVDQLAFRVSEEIFDPVYEVGEKSESPARLLRALRVLQMEALTDFTPGEVEVHEQTGLEELPLPVEEDVELPFVERIRSLIASLEEDAELFALARMAKRLMVATTLPRHVSEPDEMPLGGVSDITNHGPLDRLLVSEHAYDDLTLAVRIATNEALYLRRDTPPSAPLCRRTVLLDAGIRSWGLPRVFSTAVALAYAATADSAAPTLFFRADGSNIQPVDLSTREGLIEHLSVLTTDLHPGGAMQRFAEALQADEEQIVQQPLVITSDDAYSDAEFLRNMRESELAETFVAVIDRNGRFELLQLNMQGQKLIRQAKFQLEDLFATPQRAHSITRSHDDSLPAIFAEQTFPLRLSHETTQGRIAIMGEEITISLSTDGRLMLWTDREHGALQLSDAIPKGEIQWLPMMCDNDTFACAIAAGRQAYLVRVRDVHALASAQATAAECVEIVTNEDIATSGKIIGIASFSNYLLRLAYGNEPSKLQISVSGQPGETIEIPMPRRINGRFILDTRSDFWSAISYVDGRLRVDRMPDTEGMRYLGIFEKMGVDGPIALARDELQLVHLDTGTVQSVEKAERPASYCRLVSTSHDGRFVELSDALRTVDTDRLSVSHSGVIDAARARISPKQFRNRFQAIGVNQNGKLTLVGRRGEQLVANWALKSQPREELRARQFFHDFNTRHQFGFKLQRALWPNGSAAFLDSRGLLHLRSADQSVECTIVLVDGELAGWSHDGRVWGPAYFTGRERANSAAYGLIWRERLEPFLAGLE